MAIFMWRSNALRNYGAGYIMAVADSAAEARKKVTAEWPKAMTDRWPWTDAIDDRDEIAGKTAEFMADIAKEPEVKDALFIPGSE